MKTQIQELMALYRMLDEITDIIESENSGLSAEQRLSEIEITIRNYFKEE
jgi:3-hydroxymyristoyl/3-hydroxydecanoyl-(acyl carrier protein) dehydratase